MPYGSAKSWSSVSSVTSIDVSSSKPSYSWSDVIDSSENSSNISSSLSNESSSENSSSSEETIDVSRSSYPSSFEYSSVSWWSFPDRSSSSQSPGTPSESSDIYSSHEYSSTPDSSYVYSSTLDSSTYDSSTPDSSHIDSSITGSSQEGSLDISSSSKSSSSSDSSSSDSSDSSSSSSSSWSPGEDCEKCTAGTTPRILTMRISGSLSHDGDYECEQSETDACEWVYGNIATFRIGIYFHSTEGLTANVGTLSLFFSGSKSWPETAQDCRTALLGNLPVTLLYPDPQTEYANATMTIVDYS